MKWCARHRSGQSQRDSSSLRADVRGATAIEYGLIAALVVIAMIAGLGKLADGTVGMWGNINTRVQQAN